MHHIRHIHSFGSCGAVESYGSVTAERMGRRHRCLIHWHILWSIVLSPDRCILDLSLLVPLTSFLGKEARANQCMTLVSWLHSVLLTWQRFYKATAELSSAGPEKELKLVSRTKKGVIHVFCLRFLDYETYRYRSLLQHFPARKSAFGGRSQSRSVCPCTSSHQCSTWFRPTHRFCALGSGRVEASRLALINCSGKRKKKKTRSGKDVLWAHKCAKFRSLCHGGAKNLVGT
jgi:hypothetical protein